MEIRTSLLLSLNGAVLAQIQASLRQEQQPHIIASDLGRASITIRGTCYGVACKSAEAFPPSSMRIGVA